MTKIALEDLARKVREEVIEIGYYANEKNRGAHYGGGLSAVEIFSVLYGSIMHMTAQNITSEERDILIPGKAHCILSQFATLYELGCISEEEMLSFAEDGGTLYGHSWCPEKGVDFPGGSLGMALPVSVGIALGKRGARQSQKIYCLLGDGECDEGSVWEAAMAAAHYNLENLVAIIDRNYVQLDGPTERVMALGDIEEKFRAFGWKTVTVDGHDLEKLESAFCIEHKEKPLAIIANTVKGKGISFMEGKNEWHFAKMSKGQYKQAREELAIGKS